MTSRRDVRGLAAGALRRIARRVDRAVQPSPGTDIARGGGTLDPEAVRWGYRLFLDREPEDDDVVQRTALALGSWRGVHDQFTSSAEYAVVHAGNVRPSLSGHEPPIRVDRAESPDEVQRLLEHVRSSWTALGASEPHYSVVTNQKFRPDRIDEHVEEFYASGEDDVLRLAAVLRRNGLSLDGTMTCLELGCGVGRDTVWLAAMCGRVIGMDVSENHLRMAAEHLRRSGVDNVELVLLRDFDVFAGVAPYDCFFSQIVLQHNPPPVIERLLAGAFSGLAPGGIAVFQVPTYRADYHFDLEAYLENTVGVDDMEMHVIPQQRVFELAELHDLQVIEVLEDSFTGMRPGELSNTFVMRRGPAT